MERPDAYHSAREGMRALLGSRNYRRLWMVGGLTNVTRWIEVLAAGLFTLDETGSALAVAVVTATRSLPLLCFGAIAGVLSESLDRRRLLLGAQITMVLASAGVMVLAALGLAHAWHLVCSSFAGGLVWATEPSLRRRMAAEAAGPDLVPRAVALDSVTQAVMRAVGPVLGSTAYAFGGLTGAFALSSLGNAASTALAAGLRHRQETQRVSLLHLPRDLTEAFIIARGAPAIMGVLGVTVAMNMFGFSYAALVAPIGRDVFGVSPALVGALAASEAVGALLGGTVLAAWPPRSHQRAIFLAGCTLFLLALLLLPLAPGFWEACGLLVMGGAGTAAFSNQQTTQVITHAPPAMRSRVLGLLAMCIGTGPIGQILMGAASARLGLLGAVEAMAIAGLALVLAVGTRWTLRERAHARPDRPASQR